MARRHDGRQRPKTSAVLGIDTAGTTDGVSGLALVVLREGAWRCIALTSSYAAFVREALGSAPPEGLVSPAFLLDACVARLGGAAPAVIAADLPLELGTAAGTAHATGEASGSLLAKHRCGPHTAGAEAAEGLARHLRCGFEREGYRLASDAPPNGPALVPVYPHAAILSLLALDARLPYRAQRAARAWPEATRSDRLSRIHENLARLLAALRRDLVDVPMLLPDPGEIATVGALRPVVDQIDALVCAWVGLRWLVGRLEAHGNESATLGTPAPPDPRAS